MRGHALYEPARWIVGFVEVWDDDFDPESIGRFGEQWPRVYLEAVDHRDAATLDRIVGTNVVSDSTMYTDKWKGYTNLERDGYDHWTVNHKRYFVHPDTGVHTNNMECECSHVKCASKAR